MDRTALSMTATNRDGEEFNIKSTRECCKVCNKSILTHNQIGLFFR